MSKEKPEAVRLAVEGRDKEWCYAHGWREGAFDADGKPFTPERHAEIMQEAIKVAGEGVEEAVRVAVEKERADAALFVQRLPWVDELGKPSSSPPSCDTIIEALKARARSDAQAMPAPEVCPNALLPDGPVCPRCGKARAPSGIDGGSWVHAGTPPETGEKEPSR